MSLGYACLALGVRDSSFSRCIVKTYTDEKMREIIKNNLNSLNNIIDYNIRNNIKLFRISSDIIPLATHSVNNIEFDYEFRQDIDYIGQKIKENSIRVSMHPGQYTVLNSKDENVVDNAIRDIEYHTLFLDTLGVDYKNKIVIHIGGVYGDKESAIDRFKNNFKRLSQSAKKRLIIENDDKSYNIRDVLDISYDIGLPVVFDNLHNSINEPPGNLSEYDWISICGDTWKEEDGVQKIHYSQQNINERKGAHSKTINLEEFINFYNRLESKIDIMLEVKDKNLSTIKCQNAIEPHINNIEKEWARYKYLVLSKSASIYNNIRKLLKNKNGDIVFKFYDYIDYAMKLEFDKGAQINGVSHVWGYVNKYCTQKEKARYNKYIKDIDNGKRSLKAMKNFIYNKAIDNNIEYLINSLYFFMDS